MPLDSARSSLDEPNANIKQEEEEEAEENILIV
jgi:hypothetical protein